MIELKELIPVVTPAGTGYAILVEGGPHDNYWTIVLDEGGGIITYRQQEIRVAKSYTYGRGITHAQMRKIAKRKIDG
jgi:hypothetical protein